MDKYLKSFTLFLVLLHVLNYAQCTKCSCRKKMNERKNSIKLESEETNVCQVNDPGERDNHLPIQNCNYGATMKGKIINPFQIDKNHIQDIFKSACIKCAVCLAIARTMNETFYESCNENFFSENPTPSKNYLYKNLKSLCTNGFKNYDLRQIDENVLLTVPFPKSKHISTSFDGFWTGKLREICHKYLDNIECNFNERVKSGSTNFVEYLCNGDGLFRDCRNIKLKLIEYPDQQSNLCPKCN